MALDAFDLLSYVSRKWDDVMQTQFDHTVTNAQNPELIISSSTTGMDLILFYMRKSVDSD